MFAVHIFGTQIVMHNTLSVDLFDVLEQDIHYYSSLGCVAVCDDLNSRVGNKDDY